MTRIPVFIAAGFAAATLAACDRRPVAPVPAAAVAETPADAGYVTGPELLAARPGGAGVELEGRAAANARVRLATPAGEALFAEADERGLWRLTLPRAPAARIFGLSMTTEGRVVQAQGYVVVTAEGEGALLRAGGGAIVLGALGAPRIAAVDFDAQGAAVISGMAAPQSALSVRVDGRPGGLGRADAAGRFTLTLPQPLTPGAHQIEVAGEGVAVSATIDASHAAALTDGPFRAGPAGGGLRVDWLTPGGGVQSTWISS